MQYLKFNDISWIIWKRDSGISCFSDLNHGWQQILKCVSTHALSCSVPFFPDLYPPPNICETFCSGFPIIECCWCYSMENNRPQRKFIRYTQKTHNFILSLSLGIFLKRMKTVVCVVDCVGTLLNTPFPCKIEVFIQILTGLCKKKVFFFLEVQCNSLFFNLNSFILIGG